MTTDAVVLHRVLIISQTWDDQASLRNIARQHQTGGGFNFQTTASFGQDPGWWAQEKIALLILVLPLEEDLHQAFLNKLKSDVPRALPVILVSWQISETLLELTQTFSKMRLLKHPLEAGLAYRAVIDLTTQWGADQQQAQLRHSTNQPVMINKAGEPVPVAALLRNLSVGGAYLELQENTRVLKPTDQISIEIEIPQVSKYVFQARIVWTRALKPLGVGLGCAFLDMDEEFHRLTRQK